MTHLVPQIYSNFDIVKFMMLKNYIRQMGVLLNKCACQLCNIYYIENEID